MDIRVTCLIYDEDDIWEQTLTQLLPLFDRVYVALQTPTGRVRAITSAAQRQNPMTVSTYILPQSGYFRTEVSRLFARIAFSQGADWVLFADGDEFIRASNRSDLEAVLSGHEDAVVNFRRRNLVPSAFGDSSDFSLRQRYRTLAEPPVVGKVAISAGWAARFPHFEFTSNLTAVAPWSGAMPISGPSRGEYLHIPVRSVDQLRAKVEAGIAAYEATFGSDPQGVAHWRAIRDRLQIGVDEATLAQIALAYDALGSGVSLVRSGSHQTVEETAFIDGTLPIADSITQPEASATRELPKTSIERLGPVTTGKRLALLSGSTVEIGLQAVSGRGAVHDKRFGTLPRGLALRLDEGHQMEAIGAAFQPIETPLAGDTAIHLPALFFLWRLLAPRRYVELGSRQGATFFAACQAARRNGKAAECIAIDTWNDQSPLDAGRSFADFQYLLSTRYPQVGHYIRGRLDDAAWCFEDASIDVLYVDGCREDAAVKHNFELWRSKMSDRGVILVHGTAESEMDPEAEGNWKDIEATYPAWNLQIGRGLGVVYVGDTESEAAALLVRLRQNTQWSGALTEVVRGAAKLSLAEASRAVARLVASRSEITKERLSKEREEVAAQVTSRLHASLSWRITAPLRLAGRLFRGAGGSRNE